jgi:hypothetical protein
MEPPTYLAKLHPHERDERIEFDEGPHIYYIDGSSEGYISCTTWNHSHFEHFNADKIIDKMMSSSSWQPGNKYYGKTKDEIKAMWDKNRDESASAGTKMHYDIECYYNEPRCIMILNVIIMNVLMKMTQSNMNISRIS